MSVFAPLRHPAFRLLSAGRAVNTLGNTFAPIALAFAVLDLSGSASDLGLVVGARTIVNVAFLLFGGVLADRLPRHLLLVGASALAAVTQGAIAALVLTGDATVPLLIGLSAVNGMVGALAMPASSALLPQTVPAAERQQANALTRLFFNGTAILGAPVAGLVVATVGPGWGITVDAATFLIAGVCFAFLRIPAVPVPGVSASGEVRSGGVAAGTAAVAGTAVAGWGGVVGDLAAGWGEFRSRAWLWVVVAGFSVLNASWGGGLNVLGPTVADHTIGRRAWGFVVAAQTVGMIVGAVLAMRVRVRRLLFFGTSCVAVMALPIFVLGVAPHLGLLVPAAFVAGVGLEQFGIAWETTMQEHVPADKLARVYSYDMVGSLVAVPIGEIVVGPVAGLAGVEATLVGAAALVTLSVLGMLSSRDVRELRHSAPQPIPVS